MLVAVAAMTFTACQNDNGEMDMLVKKTVITGVASLGDDTRSGFVGSETIENEDGTTTTVYKSAWDGTETIKLFAENGLDTTATIDAEGKFTAEFEGELSEKFFMTVCSPAESWSSQYTCTIPSVQTPSADTVDPAAHIVQKQSVYVVGGTADYFKMEHQVAYGKMTVNTPDDFVIDHVDIELNGEWYDNPKSLSYTINAKNVEDNTFWFATDVIEVTDFTVTAYNAEGNAYTKSVTIPEDRELSFKYGEVSKFSVSNLEVYEEPAAFTSAYTSGAYYTSDYIIMFEGPIGTLKTNPCGITTNNWELIPGVYNVAASNNCFYNGTWTAFNDISSTSGTISVSVVDGMYHFEFNIKLVDGTTFVETYTGLVAGLNVPDMRQALATPNVNATVDGKTITISWEAVENAESYLIECTSSNDIEPISTTETTATITVPTYDYYSFSVQAVVSEDSATYRSSEKAYVEYNDPRVVLSSPTNITATVNGPSVTISWDAVEGADGYQLRYYLNGNQVVDVDDTTATIDLGYNQSNVWIYVFSVAYDTNNTYRSSEFSESYVEVSTDKDPNVLADIIATSIAWDGGGYFVMKGEVVSGTAWGHSSDYIRLYLNEADRPGNNSINVGHYTGCSTATPSEDEFGARFSLYWGSVTYPSAFGSASTLDVDYDETTGYKIVITHNGVSYGYKGMPDGWEAPVGGGNGEPENPGEGGGDEPDELGSKNNPYEFTSAAVNGFFLNFEGAQNGASIQIDRASSDVRSLIGTNALNNSTFIYPGSGNVYTLNGTTYPYVDYASYSTIEVISNGNAEYTCNLKMSVNGGTPIYYTFTGHITGQNQ